MTGATSDRAGLAPPGKMYFATQVLVRAGPKSRPTVWRRRRPSGVEQVVALLQEARIGFRPDMLEHADRDDAVEAAGHVAIILQEEADLSLQSALGRALLRDRELLGRERHAGHRHAEGLGEVDGEAAIARADVEHAHARLEEELRREVLLLPQLGLVEAHLRRLEIGAGILEVRVEEERVEPPVEVVVVRGIVAGAGLRVRDMHVPGQAAEAGEQVGEPARPRVLFVRQDEREEIVERPVLDDEAAVHERFAELHLRVEDDGALDGGRGEADSARPPGCRRRSDGPSPTGRRPRASPRESRARRRFGEAGSWTGP